MPRIKPFTGIHATQDYAERVYICHSDAGNPEKSRKILSSNPYTLLHLTHGDLIMDTKDEDEIRRRCNETFNRLMNDGILVKDPEPSFYIYRLSMANHSQTGLVACVDIRDYINGDVKKHELTRNEKAKLQVDILKRVGGSIEPILLAYNSNEFPHHLLEAWTISHDSMHDFLDEGGTRHELWRIDDQNLINKLEAIGSKIESFYICDGHHRIAAAANFYEEMQSLGKTDAGLYFLATIFPSDEMLILDYNRAVKDLNGMSHEEFLSALKDNNFSWEVSGTDPIYPEKTGEYTMVIDDTWYRLEYLGERDNSDPVAELDVSILQEQVLEKLLGIKDPQHDSRLSFISGTKGLSALQNATHEGMAVAFALAPPTMEEIIDVCDAGLTMPPKSTCFEPKMAGGVIVYHP